MQSYGHRQTPTRWQVAGEAIRGHIRRLSGGVVLVEAWPALIVAGFFVLSRTAGGDLPRMLFRVSLLVFIANYVWTRTMMSNLQCLYDSDRRELQRGEEVELTLRFDNEGFVPITRLEAVGRLPGQRETEQWRLASTVPGLASRLMRRTTILREHGHYRLGPVTFRVSDPFGWFEGRADLYGDRYVTVYPRIMPVRGGNLPLRRPFGSLRTRIRSFADPSNLADIRPLRPGDNPRHIHWPTSARLGEPYVREFELTASGEVHIMIDLSAATAGHEPDATGSFPSLAAREQGFDAAAGLAASCLQSDLSVGLIARGKRDHSLEPGKGGERLRAILKSLAHSQTDCPVPVDLVLEQLGHSLGSGSTLLLVTGQLTPALTSRLTSLVRLGLGVAVFLIAETDGGISGPQLQIGSTSRTGPFSCWVVPTGSNFLILDSSAEARSRSALRGAP
ncbi:MAG: DUF58 domain-containing protein [Bacillota bacterium]